MNRRGAQRGAAALIVVMLLFFIISMVAAYASRNLIFEQKTSANQYRATQAFEAADAGLEWAVAMLNGGRIDAACAASTNVANTTFRARYLNPDPSAGTFAPTSTAFPGCVRTDAGWSCSCPGNGSAVLTAPVGTAAYPAFRVSFGTVTGHPDAVRILSTGCTRFDSACLNVGQSTGGEAAARVSVVVSLSSGLATPPSAALTVRENLSGGGAGLTLSNTDPLTNGITANAGRAITASIQPITVPGSPAENSVLANDGSLSGLSAAQMFTSVFRMNKGTYKNQPATVVLDDCASSCSAKLLAAAQANPGRILWVEGDLTLESNVVLGSAAEPVLIVATGNINMNAASLQIFGLLYSQAADWNNNGVGATLVQGAAIAEGNFIGSGIPTIQYDPAILSLLRLNTGTLVRVPGSWMDN